MNPTVNSTSDFVRSQFPAFDEPLNANESFFENAGGSFACRQTIDGLTDFYTRTKVQPYSEFATSAAAGEAMDRSRARWAEALGVDSREVVFGPSTSMNTYVLAQAFGATLRAGDEVIVTNQDHEANTGAIRRAAERAGATLREWRTDADTGLLDIAQFADAAVRPDGARHGAARLEHRRPGERHRPHHRAGPRAWVPG